MDTCLINELNMNPKITIHLINKSNLNPLNFDSLRLQLDSNLNHLFFLPPLDNLDWCAVLKKFLTIFLIDTCVTCLIIMSRLN